MDLFQPAHHAVPIDGPKLIQNDSAVFALEPAGDSEIHLATVRG